MSISIRAASFLTLCVLVLAVSANVSAQNHNNDWRQNGYGNGYGYGYGYAGSPQVVVAPPSVYVIAGGIYGTGVYVTPAATLPAQNTGISLSNDAGISLTAPLQTGVNTEVPATSGWSSGTAGYSYGAPVYGGAIGGQAVAPSDNGGGESGRLINDLGPSYYAGAAPGAAVAMPSLAEVAAQYRTARAQNARMYTNADAEKIVAGVKTGSETAPAESQTAQQSAETAPEKQPAQNYGKGSTATGQSQAATQSATQPANPTTPQINPPAKSSQQDKESLPATATLLPFLTFLGLLSGGAGLWMLKFRK